MATACGVICRCGGIRRNGICDRCGPRRESRTRTVNPYNCSQWTKFRAAYLAEHTLCEDCLEVGKVELATEVHHKIRVNVNPDLMYDEDNCRALSRRCHSIRTAKGE